MMLWFHGCLCRKPEEEGEVEDSKKASEKAAKPKPVSVFKLVSAYAGLVLYLRGLFTQWPGQ